MNAITHEAQQLADALLQPKVLNGTTYDYRTHDRVIEALEELRQDRFTRARIWYGDTATGRSWLEEHDVVGYISRSMGTRKIPILLPNVRSTGGGGILDHCIVRIDNVKQRRVLYCHPHWHGPQLEVVKGDMAGYEANVNADGLTHARFKTRAQADRWVRFMIGARYAK